MGVLFSIFISTFLSDHFTDGFAEELDALCELLVGRCGEIDAECVAGLVLACEERGTRYNADFLFEGFLYGFGPSAVNIPANGVQGLAGLILGCVLIKLFEKSRISY